MEKKRMVYISGPISGLAEEEYRRRFGEAERLLRGEGHLVVNPTTDERVQKLVRMGAPYRKVLRVCIDILDECDSIFMLDGWMLSKGASAEFAYANAAGMDRRYELLDTPGASVWFPTVKGGGEG